MAEGIRFAIEDDDDDDDNESLTSYKKNKSASTKKIATSLIEKPSNEDKTEAPDKKSWEKVMADLFGEKPDKARRQEIAAEKIASAIKTELNPDGPLEDEAVSPEVSNDEPPITIELEPKRDLEPTELSGGEVIIPLQTAEATPVETAAEIPVDNTEETVEVGEAEVAPDETVEDSEESLNEDEEDEDDEDDDPLTTGSSSGSGGAGSGGAGSGSGSGSGSGTGGGAGSAATSPTGSATTPVPVGGGSTGSAGSAGSTGGSAASAATPTYTPAGGPAGSGGGTGGGAGSSTRRPRSPGSGAASAAAASGEMYRFGRRRGRGEGFIGGFLVGALVEHIRHEGQERKFKKKAKAEQKKQATDMENLKWQQKKTEATMADQARKLEAQRYEAKNPIEKVKPTPVAPAIIEKIVPAPEQTKPTSTEAVRSVAPAETVPAREGELELPAGHRLETSAWHTYEIDESGHAVESSAIEYGREYQNETSHENIFNKKNDGYLTDTADAGKAALGSAIGVAGGAGLAAGQKAGSASSSQVSSSGIMPSLDIKSSQTPKIAAKDDKSDATSLSTDLKALLPWLAVLTVVAVIIALIIFV